MSCERDSELFCYKFTTSHVTLSDGILFDQSPILANNHGL